MSKADLQEHHTIEKALWFYGRSTLVLHLLQRHSKTTTRARKSGHLSYYVGASRTSIFLPNQEINPPELGLLLYV